jgi:PAS domain-containing protein
LGFRQHLGADLKSTVDLAPTVPSQLPQPSSGQVILSKQLSGSDGKALAYLQVSSDAPSIRDIYQLSSKRLQNFIVIVVPVAALLFWFLTKFVTAPLTVISGTLKSHDPDSLDDLATKHNEFGQIAALLGDYFRQNRIELSDAHARLRASINSINIGFVMTDVNQKVTIINDAARKILFGDAKRAREVSLAEIDGLLPGLHIDQSV